jgi:hypothetical protein
MEMKKANEEEEGGGRNLGVSPVGSNPSKQVYHFTII